MLKQNFEELFKLKSVSKLASEIFFYNLNKLITNQSNYIKTSEILPLEKTSSKKWTKFFRNYL